MIFARLINLIPLIFLGLAILSVYMLELARSSIDIEHVMLGDTPVTFYNSEPGSGQLVVVSHGFGGSRQMMEAISLTLARAEHTVVAFDYLGHGRHTQLLSSDIATLTGTTQDLVKQTLDVVERARERTGLNRVSFVGHSMATDVIVRAAERLASTEAVVAISMYSDAVTPIHPARLLVISGASEGRLREVALGTVAQIGDAREFVTVERDGVARRAVSAAWVGHVGVLWSSLTSREITAWLGDDAAPVNTGPWIAALLLSILMLFWPLASTLPRVAVRPSPGIARAALAGTLSAVAAGCVALIDLSLNGLAGFGTLWLSFAVWGFLVLLILRAPIRLSREDFLAGILLLAWGIGTFALALDRYGAAFLPTGPRLPLALLLLPATVIFALADRILVHGRGLLARIVLRVPFVIAMFVAMIAGSTEFGLLFTVLPVLILFWVVYGTMTMWAARRTGPVGAGFGAGIILAWAIAASTPLFNG